MYCISEARSGSPSGSAKDEEKEDDQARLLGLEEKKKKIAPPLERLFLFKLVVVVARTLRSTTATQ